MRVVNVAQGALIVLGAYLSHSLFTRAGHRPVRVDPDHDAASRSRSASGCQLAFLRPLRSDEREQLSLLVTWAVALGHRGRAQRRSTRRPTARRSRATRTTRWSIGGYVVSQVRVYGFADVGRDPRAALPDPRAQPLRALGARDDPEPGVGAAARHRSAARRRDRLRPQRRRRPPRRARCTGSCSRSTPAATTT